MPRTKKAPGTAADSRNGRQVALPGIVRDKVPAQPRGLKHPYSKALWRKYWGDVISNLVAESEIMIVERWIKNVDRYRTLIDRTDDSPTVSTYTENGELHMIRKNPSFDMAVKIDAMIRLDEAQIGYGPKNRAALGISVIQQAASLAEMNKKYGGNNDAPNAEPTDPRLITGPPA